MKPRYRTLMNESRLTALIKRRIDKGSEFKAAEFAEEVPQ